MKKLGDMHDSQGAGDADFARAGMMVLEDRGICENNVGVSAGEDNWEVRG